MAEGSLTMRYTVIVERAENNYSAYVPDLPGCVATGRTRDETLQRIQEAVQEHIELLRKFGEPVPEPKTSAYTLESVTTE
jgi:predicted RNase H-like HicB family nuclease